jgi:hypothetical protein
VLLAATAAGLGLGVEKSVHHKVAQQPVPPPTALTAMLTIEQRLLDGYGRVAAVTADAAVLTALHGDIAAHLEAINALLERYPGWRLSQQAVRGASTVPPAAPSGPVAITTMTQLRTEVASAATTVSQSCLDWDATEQNSAQAVPVLGSIAACLKTHAQVLA